jgi:hypothetical protein
VLFESSRYILSKVYYDNETNELSLGPRDRFLYTDVEGIIPHVVSDGDNLWSLAAKYYGSEQEDETNYWWVIAEFQPKPIIDPTLRLEAGIIILIPPLSWIQEGLASNSGVDLSAL